ncbi:MAG: hypothetical protein E7257_10275 [Lachnospiraceae bacterium]|nr:hypothetical protein [Lachnospiraceae bacterium]
MKINIEFYKESIDHINNIVSQYEDDLERFKSICDEIFDDNWYGFRTDMSLKSLSNMIYQFSSGEMTRLFGNTASVVEDYIEDMAREDKL